ncbi:MAG: hypothetical protein K0S51_1370 [Bacillales bacterium]|jgi:hypothetical protein|nr:hypothetical protein [Bacillales bacterium]
MEGQLTTIAMIASALLVLGCLYLTISPFFVLDEGTFELKFTKNKNKTQSHKEALYSTLNEIEIEHKMGKISDDDYKELTNKYETMIAKMMKDDDFVSIDNIDNKLLSEIEKEIQEELDKREKGGK